MEKTILNQVIDEKLIEMNLKSNTKEGVIRELSKRLYEQGNINDLEAFVEDVLLREKEGITGLGQGVAIPHGKSKSVINTTIAIGKSEHDIPWETLDETPIRVVILFAVRDTDASTVHIKLLQNVARFLSDDNFINDLHNAKTKDDLLKLLKNSKEVDG